MASLPGAVPDNVLIKTHTVLILVSLKGIPYNTVAKHDEGIPYNTVAKHDEGISSKVSSEAYEVRH